MLLQRRSRLRMIPTKAPNDPSQGDVWDFKKINYGSTLSIGLVAPSWIVDFGQIKFGQIGFN